jgi:hypothetical protein
LLGDWYATLLHTRRGQFVVAVAATTYLPVAVSGRDLKTFPARLCAGLRDVLEAFGTPAAVIERECSGWATTSIGKTDDRRAVGVLTEMQRLLHGDFDFLPDYTLPQLSLRLAETPVVAAKIIPEVATRELFGCPPRNWRRSMGN